MLHAEVGDPQRDGKEAGVKVGVGMPGRPRWAQYGPVILGLLVILAFQIWRATSNTLDIDLWHELALAREIVSRGSVPVRDLFAYTPTVHPVVHHEWGAGVIAYAVLQLSGGTGIITLNFALAAGAILLVTACNRAKGVARETLAICGVLASGLLAVGYGPVRAQAYSYLIFAALLYLLEFDRAGRYSWIPVWLGLFVLWANIHASCVLGFAVIGTHWLESLIHRRRSGHVLAVLFAMLLLLSVNPYGFALYSYLMQAVPMPRPEIAEWQPSWVGKMAVLLPVLVISVIVAVYGAVRGSVTPAGVVTLTASAGAAFLHQKLAPFYAVAWLCYVPASLGGTSLIRELAAIISDNRVLSRTIWISFSTAAVMSLLWFRCWQPNIPQEDTYHAPVYPVGAADFLAKQRFHGNLMVSFNYGSYVMWKLYPAVRVSADSRYEVAYSRELVSENQRAFESGKNWRVFVQKYPTDAVLLPRGSVIEAEIISAGWRRVYHDAAFCVLFRPDLDAGSGADSGR